MNSRGLCCAACLLALVALALDAQRIRERDRVPLKHWAAPLYWQPSQRETEGVVLGPEATTQLPTTPLLFVGMTPCRVVDTRTGFGFSGAFGPPSLAGGASRTFPIQSSTTCSLPSTAMAFSMNVTVIPQGVLNFLPVYLTGPPLPNASTLNAAQGQIVANAAIVPAGTNGSVDVFASDPADVVIDINGYYTSPSDNLDNTALGIGALSQNAGGSSNTAIGIEALRQNTLGIGNTATGYTALRGNTTGLYNTAVGWGALAINTTGSANVAIGVDSLGTNTSGVDNVAIGNFAVDFPNPSSAPTGNANVAIGISARGPYGDYSGPGEQDLGNSRNVAIGFQALSFFLPPLGGGPPPVVGGSNNIAIGYKAARNVTSNSSNNIHIGSQGSTNDSATIRLGTPGTHTSFFAAGIRGSTTANNDAIPVVIDSNGQLGTVNSSRSFKEDIQDIGDTSSGLLRLRPVTFRYQKPFADGSKPIQYGLIAEEVEEVYPDLVAHSADGQIESVKYQVLDSMLLNEVQRQHAEITSQAEQIRDRKSTRLNSSHRL